MHIDHRLLAVNGIELSLYSTGPEHGKPVWLLHGFPECWYAWHPQIEALAAATAMVAFADSVSSAEEREELLAVFEEEDRLTDIDLDDLFDAFDDYAERFAEDATAAENEALTAVAVFDDSPDLGRLIVRSAVAVASSDGALSPAEQKAVERLCDVLGLEVMEIRKPVKKARTEEPNDDEADADTEE